MGLRLNFKPRRKLVRWVHMVISHQKVAHGFPCLWKPVNAFNANPKRKKEPKVPVRHL